MRWIAGTFLVLILVGSGIYFSADKDMQRLLASLPTNKDVLFWTVPQRDAGFRMLDGLPLVAPIRVIKAGDTALDLPQGDSLAIPMDIDAFMRDQRTAALVIVHDGKIRLERYGLDFDAEGRWTSFSVAKSLTSTLVGAAIHDGFIKSIDDAISDYIPALQGSAYDHVSIQQFLTMPSGLQWDAD